eukprot:COSAG02_NODE_22113_length_763_cov_0.783133_1_plen_50_part_10
MRTPAVFAPASIKTAACSPPSDRRRASRSGDVRRDEAASLLTWLSAWAGA